MRRLNIHELMDTGYQNYSDRSLVPQADDLNKVFELLMLLDNGVNTSDVIANHFMFETRQSNYYREAAQYLGLVVSGGPPYGLSDLGRELISSSVPEQPRLLAKVVVNSWIFVRVIEMGVSRGLVRHTDIEEIISSTDRYSGDTIPRRRGTIVAWLDWLAEEFGCFEKRDNVYQLR